MKRYSTCQHDTSSPCENCSLSSYGRDCHGAPVNQLAYLRQASGLTQKQLADAIGKSPLYISKLERGERSISGIALATAVAIADALQIADIRDLLQGEMVWQ